MRLTAYLRRGDSYTPDPVTVVAVANYESEDEGDAGTRGEAVAFGSEEARYAYAQYKASNPTAW